MARTWPARTGLRPAIAVRADRVGRIAAFAAVTAAGVVGSAALAVAGLPGLPSARPEGSIRLVSTSTSGGARMSDDTGGLALFDGGDPLVPGQARQACVVVGASGAGPRDAVYLQALDVGGSLAADLGLTVEMGSGGGHGSCVGFSGRQVYTGTLAGLAATSGDGVPTGWEPATAAARTFRFTVEVADRQAVMGAIARADFSWGLVAGAQPPPSVPATGPATVPATAAPAPSADQPPAAVTVPAQAGTQSPTAPPTSAPTSTTAVGGGQPPEGPRGGAPSAASSAGATRPEVSLVAPVLTRIAGTAAVVLRNPAPLLAAGVLGVLFLLIQRLVDRADPRLARAARTVRELELVFPEPELSLPRRGLQPALPAAERVWWQP